MMGTGRGTEHDEGNHAMRLLFCPLLFTVVFYVERSNKAWDLGGSPAQESVLARPRLPLPFSGNDGDELLALRLVRDWDSVGAD